MKVSIWESKTALERRHWSNHTIEGILCDMMTLVTGDDRNDSFSSIRLDGSCEVYVKWTMERCRTRKEKAPK